MPQHLSRVAAPRRRAHTGSQQQATHTGELNGRQLRVDPAASLSREARRRMKIARLKQVRGSLEELIHLADTHGTLPRTSHGHEPTGGAIDAHARQLLVQLTRLLQPAARKSETTNEPAQRHEGLAQLTPPTTSGRSRLKKLNTVRVQMRLSKDLTKILAAFRRSGQDPGSLTERSLWANSAIRDASRILGLKETSEAD